MNRGCRAKQTEYFIHLDIERKRRLVPHDFQAWVADQRHDNVPRIHKEAVNTQDIVPHGNVTFAQKRT